MVGGSLDDLPDHADSAIIPRLRLVASTPEFPNQFQLSSGSAVHDSDPFLDDSTLILESEMGRVMIGGDEQIPTCDGLGGGLSECGDEVGARGRGYDL